MRTQLLCNIILAICHVLKDLNFKSVNNFFKKNDTCSMEKNNYLVKDLNNTTS